MSEHKTGVSTFDKKFYRERRNKGMRGQIGHVVTFRRVKDDHDNEELVPVSGKKSHGGRFSLRQQRRQNAKAERLQNKANQRMAQQQVRTNARGE